MVLSRVVSCACLGAVAFILHGCGGGSGGDTTTTTTAVPLIGSCGAAKDVEDCQNTDLGSCGNACCRVQATVAGSAEDVAKALNSSLMGGGPDGGYTLQPLFGQAGPGTGGLGFEALGAAGFLGQVHHMTSGPAHYNDTVNFHLTSSADNKTTTITAFSVSLIGGAFGDSGQGYKNIIMALKGANFGNGWDGEVTHMDKSCPAPQHAVTQHISDGAELQGRRLADAEDVVGTCGFGGGVPDCDHPDKGSCGNACCSLTVTVPGSPDEVVATLNSSFADGGADGNFTPSMTAEGVAGFANLSAIPALQKLYPNHIYIGQIIHMTNGKYHFSDTLNFNLVSSTDGSSTVITAFSLSLVAGAYGDAGQNYKNLKMAMDHAFPTLPSSALAPGNFPKSCPAAALV